MSEYFSAAATTKAKQTGRLTRYRSYKTGTYYDKISERYNFVDIFELTTYHIPIDFEKLRYYRENEKQPILTASSAADRHIISLLRESYFADQGNYVVLPMQLKVKRFQFASSEDLSLWEEESKEEGITFVGSIPGIVPLREILEKTGEDGLLHQASSDRGDEQIREAAVTATTTDYEEHFFPSGPCGHYECGVCYGGLIRFDKPRIFVLGYSENAPEVITIRLRDAKTKKLKYMYKLAKLMQISTMLSEITNSMDAIDAIDMPSLDDYYEDMS